MRTVRRLGVAAVCACVMVVTVGTAKVKAINECGYQDDLIQAYGWDLSEAHSAYHTGWTLLEYEVSHGYVQVGDYSWNNAMSLLNGYQDAMNSAIDGIDRAVAYKQTLGCLL